MNVLTFDLPSLLPNRQRLAIMVISGRFRMDLLKKLKANVPVEKALMYGVAAVLCAAMSRKMRLSLRSTASSLCERVSRRPAIESDVVRDAFTNISVEPAPTVAGHTHANAAALRNSATTFVNSLARYCGGRTYFVQMSKSDQRRGYVGSREWHWAKDVNADNCLDNLEPHDILFLCDVDYYVDMPSFLGKHAKPVLLYTSVPEEAVSNGENDTSFCFNALGELETSVAGGGFYKHKLWNYAADSVIAFDHFCGVPIGATVFSVERKQVGRHRQLVLFAPIREFRGPAAWLAACLLNSPRVERFDPLRTAKDGSKFVRFANQTRERKVYTTARPGSMVCATVDASIDDVIATVARLGSQNLQLPTAASWIKNNRAAAAVLTDYHRVCTPHSMPTVYPVELGVRAYQYRANEYDAEARPKLQAFMSPVVHGAFVPVPNKAAEERCVEGRINKLKKPEPRSHRFRDQCIDEFAELVVRGVILEPVCYEVVDRKQTSAAQKTSLRRAVVHGDFRQRILKCFIKSEAYQDVKDPRNISTYNDADKLDMAMFALSLSEHCKQFSWYGPGKTPREIATRVAEICVDAEYVNVSDYHRMDGTISYTLRQVERAICMKAFANHRTVLNELLKNNVDNKGILPYGTEFDQGSSHGSGCSATSLFQTLRAAFTSYLAFRNKSTPGGNKYSSIQAFEALGIHLGDDGLDADLPAASHRWAADKVGLILEASILHRGDRGVNFLARIYSPDVWEGALDSMCDTRRQLSKFHTTVRLPSNITPEQKLVEKAMSYVATDANTPVIGEFCQRVLLLSSYRPKRLLGLGNWWCKFEQSAQFPNENVGGWMDVEFELSLPEFDRTQFNDWLATCKTGAELLSPPLCEPPRPATTHGVDVVVDADTLSCNHEENRTEPVRRRTRRKQQQQTDRKSVV